MYSPRQKTGNRFVKTMMNSSISGIQRGMYEMQQSAHNIAQFGTVNRNADTTQLTEDLVNIKVQKNQVEASTKIIATADEMLGTLLDIRA